MVADYIIPLLSGMGEDHQTSIRYQASMEVLPLERVLPTIHLRAGPKPEADHAEIRFLGSLRFCLCGSRNYLEEMGMPRKQEDLQRYAFVANDIHRDRAPWERWLNRTLPDAFYYLRTDCEIAHRVAINSGLCLGFLPASAMLYYPELVEIPVPVRDWVVPMWLVVDKDALIMPCLAQAADQIGERLNRVWGE